MGNPGARTAVFYFVPEDGDDVKSPNVFSLGRAADKVRLGDVKKTFPLPGAYHFRFKKAFKSTFVWMDVLDDFEVVPRFDGAILAKVSRLRAAGRAPTPAAHYVHGHAPPVHHSSSSSSRSSSSSHSSVAIPSSGSASDVQNRTPQLNTKSSSSDLLGLHSPTQHIPVTVPPMSTTPPMVSSTSNATGGSGLLAPPKQKPAQKNNKTDDMMDLDWSSIPSPCPSPPPGAGAASLSPMKARQGIGGMGSGMARPRSTSPVKKPQAKQNLMVPTDLSSAAKDFKL